MYILAIDSSCKTGTVALTNDSSSLASVTVNLGNTHSTTLLPMIERVFSVSGLSVNDIELFACTTGPGSFTGLRIGAATVKGLAFVNSTPCSAVSSLEALAYNIPFENAVICPVINARRNQVYTAQFIREGERIKRLSEDTLELADNLPSVLDKYAMKYAFVGDAYALAEKYAGGEGALYVPENLREPSAYSVALAALYGGSRITPNQLNPDYLRKCQAEREREEALRSNDKL